MRESTTHLIVRQKSKVDPIIVYSELTKNEGYRTQRSFAAIK